MSDASDRGGLSLETETTGDATRLRIHGNLQGRTAVRVREALIELAEGSQDVYWLIFQRLTMLRGVGWEPWLQCRFGPVSSGFNLLSWLRKRFAMP